MFIVSNLLSEIFIRFQKPYLFYKYYRDAVAFRFCYLAGEGREIRFFLSLWISGYN